MLISDHMQAVAHLSTFDADEFATWTHISPLTPKADRAEAFRLKAVENTDHAEGLLNLAFEYAAKPEDFCLMVSALNEGVELRLAAAAHCRAMTASWAHLHALYGG